MTCDDNRKANVNRLNRIAGQVRGIGQMIEEGRYWRRGRSVRIATQKRPFRHVFEILKAELQPTELLRLRNPKRGGQQGPSAI